MKIYIYILQLSHGIYYCGITNDIERRFREHTLKKQSWASKVGVKKIVLLQEVDNRKIAARIEKKIKMFGVKRYYLYFRVHNKFKF